MVQVIYSIMIGEQVLSTSTFDSRLWDPDDPDDGDIAARMIAREAAERDAGKIGDDSEFVDVLLTTAAGRKWLVRVVLGWERTFFTETSHEIPK